MNQTTAVNDRMPKTRAIIFFPDPRLRKKAPRVIGLPGDYISGLAADLIATAEVTHADGIAAPQVGEDVRVIAVKVDGSYIAMVNPEWVALHDGNAPSRVLVEEGCLSFPGVKEKVERARKVSVVFTDLMGEEQTLTLDVANGGQAVQHECEHLEGRLLIDHLPVHRREKVRTFMKRLGRITNQMEKKAGIPPSAAVFRYMPGK